MLDEPRRERMLNVPAIVVALLVVLGLVHALLSLVLTPEQTTEFLLLFAFIPARYDASVLPDIVWPGGWAADIWTFVTYALIHADLSHLIFNAVWFLAFGSPVAQRFGPLRFGAFMAATAAAGAAVHLATHFGELLPMVGASAAISGAMAAAMRFAFQRGGPLGMWRDREAACRVPAAPLAASLRDPRVLAFLLVWFGVNMLVRRVFDRRGRASSRRSPGRRISVVSWPASLRSRVRSRSDGDRARQRRRAGLRRQVSIRPRRRAPTRMRTMRDLAGLALAADRLTLTLSAVLGRGRLRCRNAEPPALAVHKSARSCTGRMRSCRDGTRDNIKHVSRLSGRSALEQRRSREATHDRESHSLRQGRRRHFDRAHGHPRHRRQDACRAQDRRAAGARPGPPGHRHLVRARHRARAGRAGRRRALASRSRR